jgi:hypothetical protein
MPGIASNSKLSCSKTHANKMVSIKFSHDSELGIYIQTVQTWPQDIHTKVNASNILINSLCYIVSSYLSTEIVETAMFIVVYDFKDSLLIFDVNYRSNYVCPISNYIVYRLQWEFRIMTNQSNLKVDLF